MYTQQEILAEFNIVGLFSRFIQELSTKNIDILALLPEMIIFLQHNMFPTSANAPQKGFSLCSIIFAECGVTMVYLHRMLDGLLKYILYQSSNLDNPPRVFQRKVRVWYSLDEIPLLSNDVWLYNVVKYCQWSYLTHLK